MSDLYPSNTKLLLHFDGADASTTFTDDALPSKTLTTFGDAQIDTAESKFGGASGLFDGTGDYLETAAHTDFDFGTGDFTVEFWVNTTVTPTAFQRIIAHKTSGNVVGGFQVWIPSTTSSGSTLYAIALPAQDGLSTTVSTLTACNDGTWHHIAFTRESGTSRAFFDGVLKQSASDTNDYYLAGTEGFKIGARGDLATGSFFNGHLDDLRITKGIARYTGTFSIPTEAFPNPFSIDQALETDSAFDVSFPITRITQALETDSAFDVSPNILILGQAIETDIAVKVSLTVDTIYTFGTEYDLLGFTAKTFAVDSEYNLKSYKEYAAKFSSSFDLNSYSLDSIILSGQYDFRAYVPYINYLDAGYDIRIFLDYNFSTEGVYDLRSYLDNSYSHSSFHDVLIYKINEINISSSFNLKAYEQGLFKAVGEFNLLAYRPYQSKIDSRYKLNAYSHGYTYIDSQHDLTAYVVIQVLVNAEHGLYTYKSFIIPLSAEHDLFAYESEITYTQAEYDLLAKAKFFGWMMNIETGAVSRYEGFNFNSMDGDIGSMDDGIYSLSGDDNNGTPIDSFVVSPRVDFGTSHLKRLTDSYVSCSSDGELTLSTIVDGQEREYTVKAKSEINTIKNNLARGTKNRYWQIKVANKLGSNFELESIELLPQVLSRRV